MPFQSIRDWVAEANKPLVAATVAGAALVAGWAVRTAVATPEEPCCTPASTEAVIATGGIATASDITLSPSLNQRVTEVALTGGSIRLLRLGSPEPDVECDLTAYFSEAAPPPCATDAPPPTVPLEPDTDPGRATVKAAANAESFTGHISAHQSAGPKETGWWDALVTLSNLSGVTTAWIVAPALTVSDPLDLTRLRAVTTDPDKIVRDLDRRGLIPDLSGVAVVHFVFADGYGRQPPLGINRDWLGELATRLAMAGGAASVTVEWLPDAAPTATVKAPIVPLPDVTTKVDPKCIFRAGFADDTDRLLNRPQVVRQATQCVAAHPDSAWVMRGYTHPVPGNGNGYELSLKRALVIKTVFVSVGVPADDITVIGLGDQPPPKPIAGDRRLVTATPTTPK